MKRNWKSDSGYSLGLVIIFVMAVGTVLGSVMSVTQLSADAQGRGVDQLKVANAMAITSANVIADLTDEASSGIDSVDSHSSANCGLPLSEDHVRISCIASEPSSGNQVRTRYVTFTSENGFTKSKLFSIEPGANSADPARVLESQG